MTWHGVTQIGVEKGQEGIGVNWWQKSYLLCHQAYLNSLLLDSHSLPLLPLQPLSNRLEGTFGSSCQDGERMDLQSSTCSLIGVCAQKLTMEEMLPLTGDNYSVLLVTQYMAWAFVRHVTCCPILSFSLISRSLRATAALAHFLTL